MNRTNMSVTWRSLLRFAAESALHRDQRRRRRRPALLLAAVLLLVWGWVVLESELPALLAILAAATGVIWVLRHHRDLAGCVAVAAGTAAAPAVTCLVVMNGQTPGAADIVAVLTGYILVSPIPTLLTVNQYPVIRSRPVTALLGSLVLLLGAIPVIAFDENGYGAAFLLAFLAAACLTVRVRHRRAAGVLFGGLCHVDGWTDLGHRALPDGTDIHRLLVGRGNAIAAVESTVASPGPAARLRALRAAVTVADTLGLPVSRVQPVVLSTADQIHTGRFLVNTGDAASWVIVTGPAGLHSLTRGAPRRILPAHRALVAAAALPTRPGRPPR